jgi:DNA invertase Pin-like site-specific DNA recombinase
LSSYTKHRDGFNEMVAHALAGKIDFILTKSVSRFARNTVDSLTIIRQLKEKGVFVYFEKENIDTGDAKGELLLTVMSSLAQEESRSISENVSWGLRKKMADGKVSMCYGNFLGYRKGADGEPEIVEEAAEVVRLIYKLYLNGLSPNSIARHLTRQQIPTPRNKHTWGVRTIMSILSNEKYAGCSKSQKTYCESFLTHKMVKNNGELPQYWVEDSHPAIVSRELYDLVQDEIRRNSGTGSCRNTTTLFGSRIVCGSCGAFYGKKVWGSNTKYRRIVWQCNGKYQRSDRDPGKPRGAQCHLPHLRESQLEYAFVTALNQILAVRDDYFAEYETVVAELTDTAAIDRQIEKLTAGSVETYNAIAAAMETNARKAQNQDDYEERFGALNAQYEDQRNRLAGLAEKRQGILARRERLNLFLEELRGQEGLLTEFDEALFRATVDRYTIRGESEVAVLFRDGTEISVDVAGK